MAKPLRMVVLNHFFEQDIAALREAAGTSVSWRVVPYWRFREAANRRLPQGVQHGVAAYAAPELAGARARYASWLRREIGRLYCEWPFDVLLLPSDAFYYVRALPPICHELGVPVVVAQKETTITDRTFEQHVPDVRAYAPFVADYMTVCSERHKRFWVESGADAARIEVTGQPRFDLYATDARPRSWVEVGLEDGLRTILFLSYHIDAYLEGSGLDWGGLRAETEAALFEAVAHGWRVVVKLHPQQAREEETARLAEAAPEFGRSVVLASADADTRLLLLLADVVVGFQSTALLEALALPKPVAYAGWGDLHEEVVSGLIPFPSLEHAVALPASGDELLHWLVASLPEPPSEAEVRRRTELVQAFLGPFDGRASERTLAAVERLAAAWQDRRNRSARRQRLDRLAVPAALGLAGGYAAAAAAFGAVERAGSAARSPRIVAGARRRRRAFRERLAATGRTVRTQAGSRPQLKRGCSD